MQNEHDYTDVPNVAVLSEYKKAAVSYIAGYVARMAAKRMSCLDCCEALGSKTNSPSSAFLAFKDHGGLFKPSSDVIKICEETEKQFLRMLAANQGKLPQCKGIPDAIATSVLSDLNLSRLFKGIEGHMFDSAVDDNHIFNLIKTVAKCFCKVRLHHLGKEKTEQITTDKVRKKLSKLILFKNQ